MKKIYFIQFKARTYKEVCIAISKLRTRFKMVILKTHSFIKGLMFGELKVIN